MKLAPAISTAQMGITASARVLEVSSHNTANAVTDGFVPLQASMQALDNGGVRVRVRRGDGGANGVEAAAGAGSRTDLVEETANRVTGAALYRANLASLKTADETEGVLVRMTGRNGRNDGDSDDASG